MGVSRAGKQAFEALSCNETNASLRLTTRAYSNSELLGPVASVTTNRVREANRISGRPTTFVRGMPEASYIIEACGRPLHQ